MGTMKDGVWFLKVISPFKQITGIQPWSHILISIQNVLT